jgi:hypothetical protein
MPPQTAANIAVNAAMLRLRAGGKCTVWLKTLLVLVMAGASPRWPVPALMASERDAWGRCR